MRITPLSELENRYRRLQGLMAEEDRSAVLCLQNADLFYFTGSVQAGCLYIPAEGQPIYLVRRDFERARTESLLQEVVPFGSFKDIPRMLGEYGYPEAKNIGMELDVLPVHLYERCRSYFPGVEFFDATPLIRKVRMCKSAYELQILEEAALQVDTVYRRACEAICEGMDEIELACELEFEARKNGHLGFIRMRTFNGEMFFGHTLSGINSALPTYTDTPLGGLGPCPAYSQGAGRKPIGREEPIVVDFAGSVDGYLVDQTRIFAIGGLSDKLRRGQDAMIQVQEFMRSLVAERPTWGAVYDECLALAKRLGYTDQFMGAKGSQVSFIGHGIGLELDEYPFIARGFHQMHLEPGMVFAFEPKLVFPGEGSVGIENTFHCTEEGKARSLTISPEPIVIL